MPDAGSPMWRILGALEDTPRKSGGGYEVRCPAHEDAHASLSIGVGSDGRVLLNCHAGCDSSAILHALGLQWSDLFEKSQAGNPIRRFKLIDRAGTVVAEHVREDLPGDKKLWWEHGGKRGLNGTPVADLPLYRAPDVESHPGVPVIVCEGEKAAEALVDLGVLAVATVTGAAATPSDTALSVLDGREVWLWPDNDDVGRAHMARIALRVSPSPRTIAWPAAPEHGDAADYVATHGTAEGIRAMLVETAPTRTGPRLSIVRMSEVQPEPIEWLWQGRLARGKPTLIMGDPGLGKSLITQTIAATVSTGGPWPDGGSCEQGTAVLFTIEDGLADTVAPRLLAAAANMQRVIAVRGVIGEDASPDERMFALTEHLELLHRVIVEEHAIYVVMDPVTAYLGPDVNAHKEAEVRAVLGPLQMLCEQTRIALVMLMHLNKGSGVSALYRAVGSIAFPAVARVVLGVAPDPNDDDGKRRLLLPIKMNIGQLPSGIGYHIEKVATRILSRATDDAQPPVLLWDNEPVTVDAASAMDRNGTPQELGALDECKRSLAQILSEGRVSANECKAQLKAAGCLPSETTLIRARKELGVKVRKEGFGGTWWWEMGESPKTLARARAITPYGNNGTIGMIEALDTKESIDSEASEDNKEYLSRAREGVRAPAHARAVCMRCGRGEETHGPQDPTGCQWVQVDPLCPLHHVPFDQHDCEAL